MIRSWKKPFLPLIIRWGQSVERRHFTEPPVLIGGCGRSGTTLLLSILSADPGLYCIPRELGLFNEVSTDKNGAPYPTRIDRLYFNLLKARIEKTARRWVEKSPSNVREIGAIDHYFQGRFKFIHLIRDGRDVVLSVHPTDPSRYWVSPQRWLEDVRKGLAWRADPRVLTIFYEDLIRNYEGTLQQICDFIGIPFSEELKDWHSHTTVRKNSAYFGEVEKLSDRSVGKWKRTKDVKRLEDFYAWPGTRELLSELGYEDPDA